MRTHMIAAAVALTAGAAAAEGPARLDVASTFPKGMVYLGESAENLSGLISSATGGDVTLEVYGAGELVPAFEVLNAVSSGAVPAGWDFMGYWGGTIPLAGLVGAMPFGLTPDTMNGWMWDGGGYALLQRGYNPLNIQVLPCHITAPEPGGWYQKEINTPEDLQGLRMRISGMGGKVLDKLGATTQQIPGGEIYVALERGRIDATEFSLPVIDKTLGFAEIAKYYYFPGWHQPASWNTLLVNLDVWNSYDEATRDAILVACKANINWSLAVAPGRQGAQIAEFREMGVDVRRFPDEVLKALHGAAQEVLAEEAERDPLVAEALASIRSYMAAANAWNDLQVLPRF